MSPQSHGLCKSCRNELLDACRRGCEGSIELMTKMAQSRLTGTDLCIHINCTAPLDTSGAIVR